MVQREVTYKSRSAVGSIAVTELHRVREGEGWGVGEGGGARTAACTGRLRRAGYGKVWAWRAWRRTSIKVAELHRVREGEGWGSGERSRCPG